MTPLEVPAWLAAALLFVVGAVSAALNVIAGGGSFIALPLMIFLGLPPTVANGTNRVAILVQNVAAVWGFQRHRVIEWRLFRGAAIPALLGALVGTWAAIEIGDEAFRRLLAILMIAVSLASLWSPRGRPPSGASGARRVRPMGLPLAFFAAGFYGGFVQAGVGYLLLAATTLAGLDLVRGNALKVLVVLAFTPLSLVLFALGGKVAWGMGAALAAGSLVGALVGVRLTVLKGDEWVRRIVIVTAIAFAILLWLGA